MSRFGNLFGGKKAAPAPAPAPEPVVEEDHEEPVVEEDHEEPVVEEVHEEPVEEEVNLENMSKRQLESYGREHGIELDRRHSKVRLLEELGEHLSNS
jgi:hypothetical protein